MALLDRETGRCEWFLQIDIACRTASVGELGGISTQTPVHLLQPFPSEHHRQTLPSQAHTAPQCAHTVNMLTEYTYVFAIGTFFALLEAYNNGASTSFTTSIDQPFDQLS